MCIGENSTRRGQLHMVIPVPVLHALLPWKVCSAGDVGRSPSLSDSEGVVSPGYQHVVSYKSLQEKAFSAWGSAQCSAQEQLNFVCMVHNVHGTWVLKAFACTTLQHQDLTEKTAFRGFVA